MRFLFDTNAVISLLNRPTGPVSKRLREQHPVDVGVSALVLFELYYGTFRSGRRDRNQAVVDALRFQVLDFDREDAVHAGAIRALLADEGKPIGAYDVLIAGQARARGLILVTRNVREFERVPHLQIADWETEP